MKKVFTQGKNINTFMFKNILNYISKKISLPLGRVFAAIKKPDALFNLRRARGWGGRLSFLFDSHAA